ncbi:hypothetical protein C9374_004427 [Naegleria lovaniensis]|uniref:Amino acid transporter transmembrane domain-containing protein n=1 Tax=Naegleria lovaniensis TaxID=51637 RepID=A0AA88KKZ9_NAELO|nr:uncharacterized protein C9374_004427 [Naegleria lovaniensis]KAG2383090.1 hypothetical protein C9374_004427 [Naegleria lovaniensis]
MNPEEKTSGSIHTLSPTIIPPSSSSSISPQPPTAVFNVNNNNNSHHEFIIESSSPSQQQLVVSIPSHATLSSSSTASTPYTMSSPSQMHNNHHYNGIIPSPSRSGIHHGQQNHHHEQHEPFFSFGSSSSFHSASTATIPNPYDTVPPPNHSQQSRLTVDTHMNSSLGYQQRNPAIPVESYDSDHFQTFPSVSSLGRLVNGTNSPINPNGTTTGTSSAVTAGTSSVKTPTQSSLTPGSVLSLRTVSSSVFSPSSHNEELRFENANNNTSNMNTALTSSRSGRKLDTKVSGISSSMAAFKVDTKSSQSQLTINNSPVIPVSSPVNVEYYHHAESKDDFSLLAAKAPEFQEITLDNKPNQNLLSKANVEEDDAAASTDEDESHRPSVETSRRSIEVLLEDDLHAGKHQVKTEKSEREHLWRGYTKTNMFFCVWNLINDVISPASVSAGYTIAQAGLGAYILSVLIFGVTTFFTLMLVYDLAHMFKVTSFPALTKKALGTVGYIIICVFIFIFNFGAVCSELIEISQVLPDLLYTIIGYESIFTNRYAILIYVTIILLPIASMKQMSSFKYASMISVSSMIIIALLITYECILGRRTVMRSDTAFNFIRPQYLSAMGSLSFVFVCHDISFEIIGSLKNSTKKRYMMVVFFMLTMAITTLFLMGISSYLIFYDTNLRDANVLDLFPKKYAMAIVSRLLVCVSLGFSICYSSFMPRFAIITVLKTLMNHMAGIKEKEQEIELKSNSSSIEVIDSRPRYLKFFTSKTGKEVLHYGVTLIVVLSAFSIAMAVSNLGIIIGLTGSISGNSMAYILPCLIYIILEKRHRQQRQVKEIMIHSRWLTLKRIAAYIVLAIGCGLLVLSLSSITYFEIVAEAK